MCHILFKRHLVTNRANTQATNASNKPQIHTIAVYIILVFVGGVGCALIIRYDLDVSLFIAACFHFHYRHLSISIVVCVILIMYVLYMRGN